MDGKTLDVLTKRISKKKARAAKLEGEVAPKRAEQTCLDEEFAELHSEAAQLQQAINTSVIMQAGDSVGPNPAAHPFFAASRLCVEQEASDVTNFY